MPRVRKADLQVAVDVLNRRAGTPPVPFQYDAFRRRLAQPGCFHLEFSRLRSVCLLEVTDRRGSVRDVFGRGFMPYGTLAKALRVFTALQGWR